MLETTKRENTFIYTSFTYLEHICVAVMCIFNYYCLGPRQSVGYAVLVLITYCLWKKIPNIIEPVNNNSTEYNSKADNIYNQAPVLVN